MLICVLNWTSTKNDKINKISAKIGTFVYQAPPPMAQPPLVGQGLLIIKASLSLRHNTFKDSSEE